MPAKVRAMWCLELRQCVRLQEEEKAAYAKVEELGDLGAEKEAYEGEMKKFEAREAAVLRFKRVGLAYRVLKDPEYRRIYDECGCELRLLSLFLRWEEGGRWGGRMQGEGRLRLFALVTASLFPFDTHFKT